MFSDRYSGNVDMHLLQMHLLGQVHIWLKLRMETIFRAAYLDLTSSFSFDSFMSMSSSNWGKALYSLLLTPAVWALQLNIFYCRQEYRQNRLCLKIKDPKRVVDLLILQYRAQLPHLFFDLTLQISATTKKRNNCKKLKFVVILCPVQATDCFVMEQWPLLKQIIHFYYMK